MKFKQGDSLKLKNRLLTVTDFKVGSIHSVAVWVTCEIGGFKFHGVVPESEVK